MFTDFEKISDEIDVDEPHSLANNPLKKRFENVLERYVG